VGLWGAQYVIASGAAALGMYVVTVNYTVSAVVLSETYLLNVASPFGLYNITTV